MKEWFVEADGTRTRVAETGQGPTLLLVHGGGPANSFEMAWGPVLPALAERSRVLGFDQVGFGQTDAPESADLTIEGRARHAVALVEELGLEDFALIGHSQGGFIATQIAAAHPSKVQSLVLVSSGTAAPSGNMQPNGQFSPHVQDIISYSADPSLENLVALKRQMSAHPERIDAEDVRPFYDQFIRSGKLEAYKRGTERALKGKEDAYAALHERLVLPALAATTSIPTLLVWGREDDFAYTSRGMELLALIPHAEMHLIPVARHSVMWDEPDVFASVVSEFIDRQRA